MVTHNFWQQYKYRLVGAGIGAFLHFVVLVLAAFASEGIFLIGPVDFPLLILADWVSLSDKYMVFLFGLGGTMMYALVGWCVGLLIEKIAFWGK